MLTGVHRLDLLLWVLTLLFNPRAESLQIIKQASCIPSSRVSTSFAKLPRCK